MSSFCHNADLHLKAAPEKKKKNLHGELYLTKM